MKLLHTSDLQLDAPFAFLGEVGGQHRQQLLKTFDEILNLAVNEKYSLLLIPGDLFDSNRPSQSTVDHVLHRLGRVAIPVCILPGNHDPYDAKSIYRRTAFPPNVTIFTEVHKVKVYPELDLAVYGNAVLGRGGGDEPLANISPSEPVRWHVALAHGNLITGLVKDPERPIREADIASCGMHYVALGDWHGFGDQSQGKVKAAYSGSPEPMTFDQREAGYVASVVLAEDGVRVDRVRVGKIQVEQLEVDVSGQTEAGIQDLIMDLATPETMLEVTLKGFNSLGIVIDPLLLEERVSPETYAIRIRDQTHPQLEGITPADFPQEHTIGKFAHLMMERIGEAKDEAERSKYEQSLQLGIALLKGKDVI